MLGDFASLEVQNTYRGSDAYELAPPVATLIKDFTMCNGDVAIAEPEGSECDL
ncbi:hypothetical protein [Piscirickettsia salmonis]|uniref:hypothetical protein n=1 Tax=Piscirickettsia salmonis TaxID=1238 RepID=UPI003A7F786F